MIWYILEGPDDVGKTTAALTLQKRGFLYRKCTEADTLPILAIRMVSESPWNNVVWDRFHLSEEVHHPDRVDIYFHRLIEQFLHTIGARCVLLTERQGPMGSWENTETMHDKLVSEFKSHAAWSGLTWQDKVE